MLRHDFICCCFFTTGATKRALLLLIWDDPPTLEVGLGGSECMRVAMAQLATSWQSHCTVCLTFLLWSGKIQRTSSFSMTLCGRILVNAIHENRSGLVFIPVWVTTWEKQQLTDGTLIKSYLSGSLQDQFSQGCLCTHTDTRLSPDQCLRLC